MDLLSFKPNLQLLLLIQVALLCVSPAHAEELDPQQAIWEETRTLLQRREYSLAIDLLEVGLEDADLFRYTSRLQQDLDAVRRLQTLSQLVDSEAGRLSKSAHLEVLSKKYRFERKETGPQGTSLVLINSGGSEIDYPLRRLDSSTWLEIAEPELQSWPDRQFVTGVFLAFDRYPDTKVARSNLNAAATTGKSVTVWIKRLEAAEKKRKQKSVPGGVEPSAKDLLLGKWSVAIKNGPRPVWEFRRGGDGLTLAKGRRRRAKWEQESTDPTDPRRNSRAR